MYQTMWYWYKDKHVDQCRKTDTTETDSLINDKLIFDNGAKVSNAESNFKNYVWCCSLMYIIKCEIDCKSRLDAWDKCSGLVH